MLDTPAIAVPFRTLWLKRMGRVQLIVYTHVAMLVAGGLLMLSLPFLHGYEGLAVASIGSAAVFGVPAVLLLICRVRDLGYASWLAILIFVPLLGILFLVLLLSLPGTNGDNRYGSPPPAPKRWMTVIAIVLVALIIASILADFGITAIEAYNRLPM